ncbi:MAG TPA: type III-A CRISPR-associated protein Cas10/Csm1 [Rhodocyclaceae bacterium]|nr:type III-A CRISPR-associated protein Cas10/Csm1 [Rhodocyclaceae bacterium]
MKLLDAGSRLALTALLHDLGKLAERAGIEITVETLESNQQLYCPHHKEFTDARGWFSHLHAAYTGVGWDTLEATGHFPDLRRASPPFASRETDDVTDSAVNAASAHHKPKSFLQWIVATADRVASGFERDKFDSEYNNKKERDNHYCARLLTLFEQIGKGAIEEGALKWRYPLQPLSPESVFPQATDTCTPKDNATAKADYLKLWQALLDGIELIPSSHLGNLPLWLDHFDSLWLTIAHAIPAATAFGVKPEVSLYDHSKATAALATALWRWHHETGNETVDAVQQGWDEKKFLLIQGDFFGIQDFIFAEGGATQKHAHKLLRGRSFQVSLLAECAALKLLEALELPSTSQIINAAGKFLIVAADTPSARDAIRRCKAELNAWCLQHTYGEIGVGIATTSASCADFTQGRFNALIQQLFEALDSAKHQRFNLCEETAITAFDGFLDRFDNTLGVCKINGRHPAEAETSSKYAMSRLAHDQIRIGEALTKHARLLVTHDAASLQVLKLDYFGYRLAFVAEGELSGKYGELARSGILRRVWDFDAADADGVLWRGYARRFVNSYVPRFDAADEQTADKYGQWEDEAEFDRTHPIKTLHHIACEDRQLDPDKRWRGKVALMTLKGDIDNLGSLFQQGLATPTFAKMASLSRQINAFFALWLPWFCEHGKDSRGVNRYRNTYTVFAGGDDFFLIGPWDSTLDLAGVMRDKFAAYMRNDRIHFSAGCIMTQPKTPVRHLARSAESALSEAKAYPDKNAISLWGRCVSWSDWNTLMGERHAALLALMARAEMHGAEFSTGLTYSLLQLSDRAESSRPEDALWRSQLHYRLARFFRDRVKGDDNARARREQLLTDALREIGGALGKYKGAYRLPLSVLLYRQRD